MSVTLAISNTSQRRILRACEWLKSRKPAEELLIVGASRDAASELARRLAKEKGAAFGWHRFSLPQLAAVIAHPVLALRRLVPLSQLGTEAIVARIVHRLENERALSRYHDITHTPGFPRAAARVARRQSGWLRIASSRNAPESTEHCLTSMFPLHHRPAPRSCHL